ncbi:hypothetical protein Forpe1208_v003172 [Fusarium oxysporum f. sp. rapae]|uniref:Uncharacterized protein n=1 Tax=Fusarium oxysporum f. sp. rapae TaxID=485398 RepID=A0A8J5P7N1_FUSOX|nr:hypothetical protein Forpe1208_v003172 [Fusarium oxysporum f. sp. rapae]
MRAIMNPLSLILTTSNSLFTSKNNDAGTHVINAIPNSATPNSPPFYKTFGYLIHISTLSLLTIHHHHHHHHHGTIVCISLILTIKISNFKR